MQTSKRPVAIAYRRVSTDKQGKTGLGLADQDLRIRDLCAQRGLVLEGEFTEIESGSNDARPELARALAAARRSGGILIVATFDRLGRRVSFLSALMEQGVAFACADAPDDEPFILHVKAAFAEEEARKISQRTKAALAELAANGYYSKKKGRVVKVGSPKNLTIDARRKGAAAMKARAIAAQARVLPEIADLRASGLSLRAIAQRVGISATAVARLVKAS